MKRLVPDSKQENQIEGQDPVECEDCGSVSVVTPDWRCAACDLDRWDNWAAKDDLASADGDE